MSFLSLAGDDGFELAPGAIARAVFGERGMLNVVELEPGVMDAYVLPGGVEHGGTAGPEGATVLDVFVPVREDYRERA